jgi:hypothetical protein
MKREEMLKLAKQEKDRQKKNEREHWRKCRKMLGRGRSAKGNTPHTSEVTIWMMKMLAEALVLHS